MRVSRKGAFGVAAWLALGVAGPAAAQDGGALDGVKNDDGSFTPISSNVTVLQIVDNAESCVYDAGRGLVLALNRAEGPRDAMDDAFVSMVGPDGAVAMEKWEADGLVLNQPYGSAIAGGLLYVADRDGGTSKDDPSRAVLRIFDLATGAPKREVEVDSPGLNDIAVAADGTVYGTQTSLGRGPKEEPDPANWKVFAIAPDGSVSVLVEGEPLNMPNGIEVDAAGNIVVVDTGDAAVLTFSPDGIAPRNRAGGTAGQRRARADAGRDEVRRQHPRGRHLADQAW